MQPFAQQIAHSSEIKRTQEYQGYIFFKRNESV
jgi:hypothetical protein